MQILKDIYSQVFIIKSDEEAGSSRTNRSINEDQINISKLAEQIARSTCVALVSFLELLAANNLTKIGLRVTLDQENVSVFLAFLKCNLNSRFFVLNETFFNLLSGLLRSRIFLQ